MKKHKALSFVESFKGKPHKRYDASGTAEEISAGAKRTLWLALASTFIPEGRVTDDYLTYQAWDSLQGLCSYIRGMLSSRAMLVGMGVGQTAASAQGAVFTVFMRDLSGTLGGVLFAAAQGSGLDAYAKQWRFFADCLNNVGYLLEIFSPVFPSAFLLLACLGSLARAITGVAAGATKAALTQHFAVDGNAADVSAKEGSQESLVTMVGMLLGMLVVHLSGGSSFGVWLVFLILTACHVFANYQAMRCLQLDTLNRPRLTLICKQYAATQSVLSIAEVARSEALLLPFLPRYLPSTDNLLSPSINLGRPFCELEHEAQQNFVESGQEPYFCYLRKDGKGPTADVVFSSSCSEEGILLAFIEAYFVASQKANGADIHAAKALSEKLLRLLPAKGWKTSKTCLGAAHWRLNRVQHAHGE